MDDDDFPLNCQLKYPIANSGYSFIKLSNLFQINCNRKLQKVLNAGLKHIGSRNSCVNAVPGKLELYRDKCGFPIVETEFFSVVYETELPIKHEHLSDTPPTGIDIVTLKECFLPLIYDYDLKLIGYDRQLALEHTTKEQDSHTLLALKGGTCVGFGIIKLSIQGARQVGPLYADDKDIAEAILKRLIMTMPEAKGFVMATFSNNPHANELMKRIGCPVIRECGRLYGKKKIYADIRKIFAQFDMNFQPY